MGNVDSMENAAENSELSRWQALVTCLVAGFMTLLDVSVVGTTIAELLGSFTPAECANYFRNSGYGPI